MRFNFDTLCFINKLVTNEEFFINKSEAYLGDIESIKYILREMEEEIKEIREDEIIDFISKYMSKIWLFQLFFDGNTRSIVVLFNYFAKINNILFYYDYDNSKEKISVALAYTFFGEALDYEKLNTIITNSTALKNISDINIKKY